jgi:hypothetical protein
MTSDGSRADGRAPKDEVGDRYPVPDGRDLVPDGHVKLEKHSLDSVYVDTENRGPV